MSDPVVSDDGECTIRVGKCMINAEGYTTDTVRWKAAEGPSIPQTQSIAECLFVQIESKICDWNGSNPRRCTILTVLFDSGLTILSTFTIHNINRIFRL